MGQAAQVIVSVGAWSIDIAAFLVDCVERPRDLVNIQGQVESGAAQLFAVHSAGELIGAYVLRIDPLETGPEGVIVAGAGHLDGVALLPLLLPEIEARFAGCRSIRFHTARPGIARLMAARGYSGQEVILRKDLK